MNLDKNIKPLKDQIKQKSEQQKIKIAEAAIKSDCISVLKQLDKKILEKTFQGNNKQNLISICKYSSKETIQFLEKFTKEKFYNIKDDQNNYCLHQAAKYGNTDLINHIIDQKLKGEPYDFNKQNNNLETPLHFNLKYGIKSYSKTAFLLSKYTNFNISDQDRNMPHQILIKNPGENSRLTSYLNQKFLNTAL